MIVYRPSGDHDDLTFLTFGYPAIASRLDSPGLTLELNTDLPCAGSPGVFLFLDLKSSVLKFSNVEALLMLTESLSPGGGDGGLTLSGLFGLLRPTFSPLILAGG